LFLKYLRTILADFPVDFLYAAIAKIALCGAQSSEYLHRRQFARNGRTPVRGIGMAAVKGGKTLAALSQLSEFKPNASAAEGNVR
jgi:hypothetical protein